MNKESKEDHRSQWMFVWRKIRLCEHIPVLSWKPRQYRKKQVYFRQRLCTQTPVVSCRTWERNCVVLHYIFKSLKRLIASVCLSFILIWPISPHWLFLAQNWPSGFNPWVVDTAALPTILHPLQPSDFSLCPLDFRGFPFRGQSSDLSGTWADLWWLRLWPLLKASVTQGLMWPFYSVDNGLSVSG